MYFLELLAFFLFAIVFFFFFLLCVATVCIAYVTLYNHLIVVCRSEMQFAELLTTAFPQILAHLGVHTYLIF